MSGTIYTVESPDDLNPENPELFTLEVSDDPEVAAVLTDSQPPWPDVTQMFVDLKTLRSLGHIAAWLLDDAPATAALHANKVERFGDTVKEGNNE